MYVRLVCRLMWCNYEIYRQKVTPYKGGIDVGYKVHSEKYALSSYYETWWHGNHYPINGRYEENPQLPMDLPHEEPHA